MYHADSNIKNLTISILKNREAVVSLIDYLDIMYKQADDGYSLTARRSVFEEDLRVKAAFEFGQATGIALVKDTLEKMIKN